MNRLLRSTASKNIRVAITTGDSDGIGWEVTAKALNSLGAKTAIQFIVFRSDSVRAARPAIKKFKTVACSSLKAALAQPFQPKQLLEIRSSAAPARWVEDVAHECMRGAIQAMVTAPLSKTSILEAGLKDIGHTEILQRISGQENLYMAFVGRRFNVILATGHKPLREALNSLNLSKLAHVFAAAKKLVAALPPQWHRRPLALVGINPHAGEEGLIGTEEGWMRGFVDDQVSRGEKIVGPLVPDTAFLPKNWPLFSAYICPYHDQGLIPFKQVHGFSSGVHITLGLPFVRTSVDHGTAKELYGKNKAEAGSMKDAITTAIRLCKESHV